jgi:hypothetical protein
MLLAQVLSLENKLRMNVGKIFQNLKTNRSLLTSRVLAKLECFKKAKKISVL